MCVCGGGGSLWLGAQEKYGKIVTHCWFDDGHIMLGFSAGFLVVISTRMEEIGEELYSARFHRQALTNVAYSPQLKLAACAGDGGVKIVDCSKGFDDVVEPQEVPLSDPNGSGDRCNGLGWSPDGQILTVAAGSGCVHGFLARMSIVHASYKTQAAFLSNLKEVSVVDVRAGVPPLKVPVSVEPTLIALGAMHLAAAGSSGRVAFHRCLPGDMAAVGPEQEYGAKVDAVRLNNKYAAVLAGGYLHLHEVEPGAALASPGPGGPAQGATARRKVFPDGASPGRPGKGGPVTAMALTDHFLFYGTKSGQIDAFLLDEWTPLAGATLHHSAPIRSLHPNATGTRLVVVDSDGEAFMGNAITSDLTPFPLFPKVRHALHHTAAAGGLPEISFVPYPATGTLAPLDRLPPAKSCGTQPPTARAWCWSGTAATCTPSPTLLPPSAARSSPSWAPSRLGVPARSPSRPRPSRCPLTAPQFYRSAARSPARTLLGT